ncbi:MAG TPA: DsbA family oxidoreductase [Ohtaekwangia sp.]|uniref:DsbA family oxidoreductase n=1 Tax=Ohtaekwangia sp. TaxID=2066019 RepID=UPI002F91C21F
MNKPLTILNKPVVKIDVVSDVVCPWCYIGKRRLEKALNELSSEYDFEIEYHPFELNPNMPASGANHREYLIEKFGSEDRYEQITGQTAQVAAAEGLNFNFSEKSISPNTRKAHAIAQLAKEKGLQLNIVESLFKAYFTEGLNLADDKNLVAVAVKAGLNQDEVEQLLKDENALVQIALHEQEMYKLGISGVPFYIINNKYGVSGAQASETFVKVLRDVGQEIAAANACDVDGKNC